MTTPTAAADSDWLTRDTLPAPPSVPPPPFTGIWRCDELDAEPTRHPSLMTATAEPPQSPEAQLYGGGELLAVSADDEARWVLTKAGTLRVVREVNELLEKAS